MCIYTYKHILDMTSMYTHIHMCMYVCMCVCVFYCLSLISKRPLRRRKAQACYEIEAREAGIMYLQLSKKADDLNR